MPAVPDSAISNDAAQPQPVAPPVSARDLAVWTTRADDPEFAQLAPEEQQAAQAFAALPPERRARFVEHGLSQVHEQMPGAWTPEQQTAWHGFASTVQDRAGQTTGEWWRGLPSRAGSGVVQLLAGLPGQVGDMVLAAGDAVSETSDGKLAGAYAREMAGKGAELMGQANWRSERRAAMNALKASVDAGEVPLHDPAALQDWTTQWQAKVPEIGTEAGAAALAGYLRTRSKAALDTLENLAKRSDLSRWGQAQTQQAEANPAVTSLPGYLKDQFPVAADPLNVALLAAPMLRAGKVAQAATLSERALQVAKGAGEGAVVGAAMHGRDHPNAGLVDTLQAAGDMAAMTGAMSAAGALKPRPREPGAVVKDSLTTATPVPEPPQALTDPGAAVDPLDAHFNLAMGGMTESPPAPTPRQPILQNMPDRPDLSASVNSPPAAAASDVNGPGAAVTTPFTDAGSSPATGTPLPNYGPLPVATTPTTPINTQSNALDSPEQGQGQGQGRQEGLLSPPPATLPGAATSPAPGNNFARLNPADQALAAPTLADGQHFLFHSQAGDVAPVVGGGNLFIFGHSNKLKDANAAAKAFNDAVGSERAKVEPWLKSNPKGGKQIPQWTVLLRDVSQGFVNDIHAKMGRTKEPPLPATEDSSVAALDPTDGMARNRDMIRQAKDRMTGEAPAEAVPGIFGQGEEEAWQASPAFEQASEAMMRGDEARAQALEDEFRSSHRGETGVTQTAAMGALRAANDALSEAAAKAWTDEVYRKAERYFTTGDEAALQGLNPIQKRRVVGAKIDTDPALRAAEKAAERAVVQREREDMQFDRATTDPSKREGMRNARIKRNLDAGHLDLAGFADVVSHAAQAVARGVKDFATWGEKMVREYGERIRQYLRAAWERATTRELPRLGGGRARVPRFNDQGAIDLGAVVGNKWTLPSDARERAKATGTPSEMNGFMAELRGALARGEAEGRGAVQASGLPREVRWKSMPSEPLPRNTSKTPAVDVGMGANDQAAVMQALETLDRGQSTPGMVPVHEIAQAAGLSAQRAAAALKSLHDEGSLFLSPHDRPVNMTPTERAHVVPGVVGGGSYATLLPGGMRNFRLKPNRQGGFINLSAVSGLAGRVGRALDLDGLMGTARDYALDFASKLKMPEFTDLARTVNGWVGRMQASSVAIRNMMHEIERRVPDALKREGITNWIQAGGDDALLAAREATSQGARRAGYRAARSLSADEVALAQKVSGYYEAALAKAQAHGLVQDGLENYVNQVWKKPVLTKKANALADFQGQLSRTFKFGKQRKLESFHEGEQAGFEPVTKDISKLLGLYLNELNKTIATREMIGNLTTGAASDGRPLAVPTGGVLKPDGGPSEATLVLPGVKSKVKFNDVQYETKDYRRIDNPALAKWKFVAPDTDGKPVTVLGELAVHPEAHKVINNALSQSEIRRWANEQADSAAGHLARLAVRTVDALQSQVKASMMSLSPFHVVQEATHAVGHKVNPFTHIPSVDPANPAHVDMMNHGLMLAGDRVSMSQFMDGFAPAGSWLEKIPGIGKWQKAMSEWTFEHYIPGLKIKTYENILRRNTERFDAALRAGEMKLDDVKYLSAKQTNAAYGHLNYKDMGRNPTFQHLMRLCLLAPDFLEARTKFTGQAIQGVASKIGREQALAMATLAVTFYVGARAMNAALNHGDSKNDLEHLFAVQAGNRTFTMRSVPEDIYRLVHDWRSFAAGRVSPLIGTGVLEGIFGINRRGEKVTGTEAVGDALANALPMSTRMIPGVSSLTKTQKNTPVTPWEQFLGAMGLQIGRHSPITETQRLGHEFAVASGDESKGSYPVSKFQQLRYALEDLNWDKAAAELQTLKASGQNRMRLAQAFKASLFHPYTGSKKTDEQFKATLKPDQRDLYQAAEQRRQDVWARFQKLNQ